MTTSEPTNPPTHGGAPPTTPKLPPVTPSGVGSAALPGGRTWLQRSGGFVVRHPGGIAKAIGAGLLAIVVLQNVEPVPVDLLFWDVATVPKLVLILVSMVLGAVAWELLRRALGRR